MSLLGAQKRPAEDGDDGKAPSAKPETPDAYGEWRLTVRVGNRERTSLLALSRGPEGRTTGQWVSTRRLAQLQDVTWKDGRLRFTWESRGRDGEPATRTFEGTIEDDQLTGTLSTERGERAVKGERIPPLPALAGDWAMGYSGDRISSTLAVRRGEEGELTATWRDASSDEKLGDFSIEDGKVMSTYKGSKYEGRLRSHGDLLDGTLATERGKIQIVALRIGTALIGAWELDVTSERGTRAQRLRIAPDLSGWYNATPVTISVGELAEGESPSAGEIASLADRPLRFTASSGDRELSFEGSVVDGVLRGEITSARGTAKVSGRRKDDATETSSRTTQE